MFKNVASILFPRKYCLSIVMTMLFLLSGCKDSEVSLIQNSPVFNDKSITYGKLFDTYKYISNGNWKVVTTDRGAKIVEFRANYNLKGLLETFVLSRQSTWDVLEKIDGGINSTAAKQVLSDLDNSIKTNLIAQFKISADGKTFSPSYIGIEYNGESNEYSNLKIEYDQVVNNRNIRKYPSSLIQNFGYMFRKVYIKSNFSSLKKYAITYSIGQDSYNIKNAFAFIDFEKITFNDVDKKIKIIGSLNLTDVMINDFLNEIDPKKIYYGRFIGGFLEEIKFVNLEERNIKKIPFEIDAFTDAMPDLDRIEFFDRSSAKVVNITLGFKALEPNNLSIKVGDLIGLQPMPATSQAKERSLDHPDAPSVSTPQDGPSSGAQKNQIKPPLNSRSQSQAPKEIKATSGAYAFQEEGFDGQLMLYANKDSLDKYFMDILTSNTAGNTCNFEGECTLKGGLLVCSNDDINENNGNYIEINIKENDILDITKSYGMLCGAGVFIDGIYKPKCLDRTLRTNTVSGTYLGWFEAEEGVNTVGIKASGSNEEIYLVASEEDADRFFGKEKGQKISVTYDVEQKWIDNTCGTLDILKRGMILQ